MKLYARFCTKPLGDEPDGAVSGGIIDNDDFRDTTGEEGVDAAADIAMYVVRSYDRCNSLSQGHGRMLPRSATT
jgi:hypothetical protein